MNARRFLLALVVLLLPPAIRAQAPDRPPQRFNPEQQVPGFPVTGRVTCADTQHAARFAEVLLLPATAGGSDFDRGHTVVGRTDLDGRFTIPNVPPGEYFATAELSGYVNEGPMVRAALGQGGDPASISGVPRLQVSSGGGAVQFSLQRGSVLSGAVTWDDGSPAAGLAVGVQAPPAANGSDAASGAAFRRGAFFGGFGRGAATDDRGRFRLSGLAPGSYILQVTMQAPLGGDTGSARFARTLNLAVFAPNKLRRTEAAVFTLAPGEERTDANLVINLNGLHTVSGEVSSSAGAVHSGSVQVTDQTDGSLARRGVINADGSFSVPYVPPGTYTLRVNASAQQPNAPRVIGSPDPRFQPLTESITVADGDLANLSLTVTAATAP